MPLLVGQAATRSSILRICFDMLEPNHKSRRSAAALLHQMDLLLNPWSDPVFGCFCIDCIPRKEPESVVAEAALSARQQRIEEPVALSAYSSSISDTSLWKGDAIAQRDIAFCLDRSIKPISGKRGGKTFSDAAGYWQNPPGNIFSPGSHNVDSELDTVPYRLHTMSL